ncbi:hypothetical protein M8C21_026006, partial [Ambrosia artemisiifolia]
HRSTSDHVTVNRGGGARGGRGGGRGDHVRCCYRCGDPTHFVRDCPFPGPYTRTTARRDNHASVNEPLKVDVIEFTSGTNKVKTKPMNSANELSTNLEPVKSISNKLPPKSVDESPLLAKIQEKEKELQLRGQEIDSLKTRLNKATAELSVDVCSKTSELESLVLYYSNRAAKRMSIGKIRKALDDCKVATRLDPGFLNICLTAGSCHLVLGDIDDALYNYKKCLDSRMVCLDRRLTIEASDGLQKAEKVVSCISKLAELLQDKTFESATTALEVVEEALSISRYSEKLLETKGEALLMLHKYEEVIQMCEQTLTSAENNCNCATIDDTDHMPDEDQVRPLKDEGNKAFKGGKYREAVKHYSKAIMQSIESKSFTAICLCNRAAALQALGEVTDAIADCNLAIALDGDYMKAISRRAKLHEKIRDYENAAIDFQRLISLLEKQSERKYEDDLTVARRHLSSMNKNMKKGLTLDLYLILGLKGSESSSEIKKAYHKAALRHHPDKAGKFLARSESGLDGQVWKEIFTTIHRDADKLFKKIGEAYAVLSDTKKRFSYNLQDTMHDDFGWNFNE